jgi:beta-glucosidase-like glycosyl hydrolase
MEPARAVGSPGQVALRALDAGNDILLEPISLPDSVKALEAAMLTDPTQRARIQAAAGRVLAAKEKLNRPPVSPPGC